MPVGAEGQPRPQRFFLPDKGTGELGGQAEPKQTRGATRPQWSTGISPETRVLLSQTSITNVNPQYRAPDEITTFVAMARNRPEGEKKWDDELKEERDRIAKEQYGKPFQQLTPKQRDKLEKDMSTKASEAIKRELKARRDAYEEERFDWNKFLAGRGGEGKPLAKKPHHDLVDICDSYLLDENGTQQRV